ncbi:MAG: 2-C-methyl-D-erythritol 2,4-cyclodiphosphate synthase [Flavobacteriales bacterium]|nr:2-C-methyl-D-erythritol 2,4-cyclodiphosphate synthase [Flavobacteriales bacterium]MBO97501.1 2-C-methyl-D-erythritol 2,4-cyclodiphosphate synthase [Flavobacteriales bacterium]|tara:strand:- start:7143 stop:7622 length:480 start_codon:yes stop_codon:yes gene_type:complete
MRIGFGFDIHQLREGLDFWLGGIKIPYEKGSYGHSDADVLIHAICDALLGAANLGDIGKHFPDSDPRFKNIDSKVLLKEVDSLLKKNGYSINNIDSTICLQEPKIEKYINEMQKTLSHCISLDQENISIKATTSEKLGFIGKKEGVSAYAVVLIKKNNF